MIAFLKSIDIYSYEYCSFLKQAKSMYMQCQFA